MPGPITYAAVTLLAGDRLGQIQRALAAKLAAEKAAGKAKELEYHVLHLATKALEMMKDSQPVIEPPVRLYGPPLTDHVSRFTLLGAIGPDLPRYAAYFSPGKDWLFNTLHKGTPDENREKVLANTTNLIFDFWRRVGPLIDAEFSDQCKREEAKKKMQAYVLGHLCHIAADVLSHPYFESIEARLADSGAVPPVMRMGRDDVAGAFDARIADKFFGRGTDTRNKKWADWFPTPGDVPESFAKGMAESIASLYGTRAEGLPAFEEEFKKIDPAPPPLSSDLINESIDYFRNIIEIERVWTFGDWLGATLAMYVPMIFAYFGALALPQGKNLSRELTPADGPDAGSIRTYEEVVFPLSAAALGPLVTMIIVSASGRGLRAEGVTGWVQAGLSLVASVGFFASLGGAGGARWMLWFALPLAFSVFQIIFVLAQGARENSRKLLWMGPVAQITLAMFFLLLYHAWLHEGVEELEKPAEQRKDLTAFGDFAGWLAIVGALWFLHAVLWRRFFSSRVPDDVNLFANGDPRQFLRLYDDVSLPHDLKAPFDSERLADLVYPPARREIFKLWFEGVAGATLQLRIDHDRMVFRWPANPPILDQTVFTPIAAMTVEHYALLLAKTVTDHGGVGTLHVKPFRDDEKRMELSSGTVFSDHGDVRDKRVDHDNDAALFRPIGATETTAFVLLHTPRPRLAERMGQSGVAQDGGRIDLASKVGCLLQAVGGLSPRQYHATNAADASSPLLRKLFRPGDVLEIASGAPVGEQRIVEQVLSDTDVVVSSAFVFAIPAAGIAFKRAASDRGVRRGGVAQVQIPALTHGVGPNDVQAVLLPPPSPPPTAPPFGAQLMAGDSVEFVTSATPARTLARRTIVAVRDGRPIAVVIAALGAVGAATFTFQVATGPVSAPMATAARVPIDGTSITLFFTTGNFVAGDRWTVAANGTVTAAGANTSTGGVATTPPITIRITTTGGAVATARFTAQLCDTQPITVTIAALGAIGVSTFTVQVGAGPVSAPAPTGVGGLPVPGSLTTLAFMAGTFVAGDSWTIAPTGIVTPAGGNTSTGGLIAGPVFAHKTALTIPVDGTLTVLFFTPGNFVPGDSWTIAPNGAVTAAGGNTSTGGLSATVEPHLLELDAPPPPFAGSTPLDRLSDVEADGIPYVADASDVFGDGGSVMNDAADLAVLLCLGAASRLAPNDTPATPKGATKPVHRVYQVFRNWNLDRRRVNEWKTIVSGGAASERRADYRAAEEAAPVDRAEAGEVFTDAFIDRRRAAEAIVREHGWLGVFRSWVDMASRARTDSSSTEVFLPGAPSNRDLSRGMAYLLDAADGVVP